MEQRQRRELVVEVLRGHVVGNQNELHGLLATRGVQVSQASLSRDLKALGVQRERRADGVFAYTLPTAPPPATSSRSFRSRFATSATGVRRSGFVVLVLTHPGEAQLVGRLLDQASVERILGTVAGDDTVICVCEDEVGASQVEEHLRSLIA